MRLAVSYNLYPVEDDLVKILFYLDALINHVNIVVVLDWFLHLFELAYQRVATMRLEFFLLPHTINLLAEKGILLKHLIQIHL
jgi:hypothetical protein